MRITVLSSGSKGNSTLVASSRTRILVDAGLSARELVKRMKLAAEDPASIDAVVVTHEHQDHVQGVAVLARKLGIPVYFTAATHQAWVRWMTPRKRMTCQEWLAERRREQERHGDRASRDEMAEETGTPPGETEPGAVAKAAAAKVDTSLPSLQYFCAGACFAVGDIAVTPFTIPHDAVDPVGFVFQVDGVRLGMVTDLGYMPSNVAMALQKCDVLMIESNHDLEMLRDGPYPWPVKQRVLSRVGHLSNDATSEFLEKSYDGHALYIVLAHLSEKNNLPELARVAAEKALASRGTLLGNHLLLARQEAPMEPLMVS